MTHFANKYIGLPYVAGAQGSDSFDCWGFVRFVLLHEYGHNVPPVNINPDNLRDVLHAFRTDLAFQAFNKVKTPQDGDVVLMRQAKNPVHAGLWLDIDGGGVLHCVRGSGVVFQNIHSLNASGWYLHSFYRVKK
ncbi:MAG: C40 family peptidase [Alphaproteobacteria bacterium]|nr:C40 family peptidase [Alphaproteobacteria bacterium]MBP3514931.1 C40 family peptidase [Alphaproteobacteria bacterium]